MDFMDFLVWIFMITFYLLVAAIIYGINYWRNDCDDFEAPISALLWPAVLPCYLTAGVIVLIGGGFSILVQTVVDKIKGKLERRRLENDIQK
jgi:hypothetical protein